MELVTFYKCACANCGAEIEYLANQSGQVVVCPKCKEKSLLPEAPKLALIELHGPPTPEFRNCPDCGAQLQFWSRSCPSCEAARKRKRLQLQIAAAVSGIVVLALTALVVRHFTKPAPASDQIYLTVLPATNLPSATDGQMILEQPRPRLPKSTNDLRPSGFVLEKRRGSDLVMAVGDILNDSENLHTGLRADIDLLDRKGQKIGTVSDYSAQLGAHQSWHIIATVTETNALSVRFAGITEEK